MFGGVEACHGQVRGQRYMMPHAAACRALRCCPPAAVSLSAGKRIPGSKHDDAASFDCVCSAVPDSSPKEGPAPIPGQHKEQQPAGVTPGLLGISS